MAKQEPRCAASSPDRGPTGPAPRPHPRQAGATRGLL